MAKRQDSKDDRPSRDVPAEDSTSACAPSEDEIEGNDGADSTPITTTITRRTVGRRSEWTHLTESEKCYRYEAVRNRLGQYLLNSRTIIDHLARATGNIDDAVASLHAAHDRAVVGSAGIVDGLDLPSTINGVPIYYHHAADQERRAGADILPLLVNQRRGPTSQITLSRAQAALVLELTDGDLEAAVKKAEDEDNTLQVLHLRYDKLRQPTGDYEDQQERQDAMLAQLIHITDRGDWWSLHQHLVQHQWNFVLAVADWQEHGIQPVRHPDDRLNSKWHGLGRRTARTDSGLELREMPTLAECTAYNSRTDIKWRPERLLFATSTNPKAIRSNPTLQRHHRKDVTRLLEFIVHHDRENAKLGCPDKTKFVIEYISAGKYIANEFRHALYFWSDTDKPDDKKKKPLFDFSNPRHLNDLNNWYRENYSRITGIITRASEGGWSEEEMAFLYSLCEEVYSKLKAEQGVANPKFRVSTATKKDWEARHKAKFGITRTSNAMMLMGTRTPKIREAFSIKPNDDNQIRRLGALATTAGLHMTPNELRSADRARLTPADLPDSGFVTQAQLRGYVDQELMQITVGDQTGFPWRCFLRALEAFYASQQGAGEIAEMQRILQVMQIPNLDLATLKKEDVMKIVLAMENRQEKANPTPGM